MIEYRFFPSLYNNKTMANKTYEYKEMVNAKMLIEINAKKMFLNFMNGTQNPLVRKNAMYSTDNEAIQLAIEASEVFKNGFVIVKEPKQSESGDGNTEGEPLSKIMDVTTVPQASDYLMENYGAAASQVSTKLKIQIFAKSKGIEFPEL